ncbi:bifunctional DedA family/phosphatase PAP2 family protein [Pseudoxanthomonas indica]|uniref:Membrane protein DedA, SNARE-associated domain n=1 Tax=Pseudoxanthomonas indica TaxID=428993 RepID=A0A1T5JWL1_9GAMM|nr:bifunctional DedA family/phosphatase PAP2 family protein [Pseudoxanthomonas indica]GGD44739.1 membrane protein [Pseudoxanthomonas indica]SKC55608.1 membrane protein DedA, SNARE-associated domain [Pseudoxanthomonas indica]
MDSWFDTLLAWISAHPVAAGAAIFAIAFCDAVIVLGAIVPALPLLFAVGVLIGLGEIDGPYALISAALGALAGDGVSFWVGHRWGPQLRAHWPFSRYPQLLDRGEVLFRRNAIKSILIARYVGPIRPFVPAVAGMLRMPMKRYLPATSLAAVSWAALFLLPGWVFGQAYDAVAAVAGRLGLVVGLLIIVMALAWALVLYSYRWFAAHADALLARALAWSHAHPVLGRYSAAVFDPRRRESVPLALLAILLLAIVWVFFAFLILVIGHGEPLGLDLAVYELMLALRNPLADYPLAAIASLGDEQVLAPACTLVLLYLCWRRRWMAAAHWLAALAFGLALTAWLGASVDIPKPPAVSSGFGFPSIAVTMATISFGFFAVLIARELPGRQRVWPYLVSGCVVALIGFARIYLGAHWLSDVIGGMLFGIVWLLVLGIAYRRRMLRSFWITPISWLFYGAFVAAALWHAPRNVDKMLAQFEAPVPVKVMAMDSWWRDGWQQLPARRNEFDDEQRWPLDVQIAGPLAPLQARLEAAGWRVQPQAGWKDALNLLDNDLPPTRQPVLPATLDTRAERLVMVRDGVQPGMRFVLRLWPANALLQPGDTPLWIGSAQVLKHHQAVGLIGMWRPLREADAALLAVTAATQPLAHRIDAHPQSHLPVLRIRTDELAVTAPGHHPR